MKIWVGLTDKRWFDFLRARGPAEVNFWQPSAGRRAVILEPGAPFLFKLHSPHNAIVGGGFYVRYSALPARVAWDAFGADNGVPSYDALRARVAQYRSEPIIGDPTIGCNVLNGPFFLPESDWIPSPEGWSPNIVQGKSYLSTERDGEALWAAVQHRLAFATTADNEPADRYGSEYLTRARLGQGAFRVLVTDAYERKCAITGEKTLPVLEAAHIQPYAENGPHRVANGLLLRSDLHTLFDRGYLTVTDELRVEVSPRIREEFSNGREYYRLHGQLLQALPAAPSDQPSHSFLRWHNENRFLAA
jgi:putative restriction endonuclease